MNLAWFIRFIIFRSNAIVRAGEKRLEDGKHRTGHHPRASRVWDHRWIAFLIRKATNCWRNKRCENLLYRYSDWSPIMVLHRILTRSILRRRGGGGVFLVYSILIYSTIVRKRCNTRSRPAGRLNGRRFRKKHFFNSREKKVANFFFRLDFRFFLSKKYFFSKKWSIEKIFFHQHPDGRALTST